MDKTQQIFLYGVMEIKKIPPRWRGIYSSKYFAFWVCDVEYMLSNIASAAAIVVGALPIGAL